MNTRPLKGLCVVLLGCVWCWSGFAADALLESERNTIDVFQKASPKVVYVHRMAQVPYSVYAPSKVVASGTGSGILWDRQGNIVTNFHVIKGADSVAVTLFNMTVPAKVIGVEPRKDLAVLRVKSKKVLEALATFTPFDMAPTHALMVGQKTIAIGNPFGFDHSLTTGVISALGRQVPGVGGVTIRDMIQTDASINPGNSGGPLLDSAGRLIGLNTVIFSQSGSSSGVGFAVPGDDMVRTVTQIIKHGRVMLSGIGIQPVEPSVAKHLGVHKGILVAEVLPNTPASAAKLHPTYRDAWGQVHVGDVIVGLNGHPVDNYDMLYNLLTEIKIGESITLTVRRNEQRVYHKMKTIDIGAMA